MNADREVDVRSDPTNGAGLRPVGTSASGSSGSGSVTFAHYTPEDPPHPGEILAVQLQATHLSQVDFAARAGLSPKHVNQVLKGSASLSADAAVAIEHVLGVPAAEWIDLDARWQEARSRRRRRDELGRHVEWAARFPRGALVERGYLPKSSDPTHSVEEILEFFGVADPDAFDRAWRGPAVSGFRRAQQFQIDELATATWLRLAEKQTASVDVPSFNLAALRKVIGQLRSLTRKPPAQGFIEARELLAACGVILTFVRSLPGSRISGATWWPAVNRPIIALSERHKRDDMFWYAMFHEIAHLLLHARREVFVEFDGNDDVDGKESEADEFAAERLIPSEHNQQIVSAELSSLSAIADALGIGVAMVAGRRGRLTNQWKQVHRYRPSLDTDGLIAAEQLPI